MDELLNKIRELQDLYDDPNIITTADQINRPEPKQEVKDIEAINEFMKRNPRADGGRIGYALGSTDNPIVPQNNLMDMSLEESTTGPGGFPMTAGVSVLPKLYDTVPKAINFLITFFNNITSI